MDKTNEEKTIYDGLMREFKADVEHKLMFAYSLIRDCGQWFPVDLYYKARSDYSPTPVGFCDYCEEAKEFEKGCYCQLCTSGEDRELREYDPYTYAYMMAQRRARMENEETLEKRRLHKQYKEMGKFDTIDAFLTERIKNALCEDAIGEIFTFL
jgi:hypothetical protein